MPEQTTTASIAVIGTGAIGTAVARTLLRAGRDVVVWNRTRSSAEPLAEDGAAVADDLVATVRGSSLALVCLTDYAAARALLSQLPVGSPGEADRTVVLLTTGSPEDVDDLAGLLAVRGLRYLDAGVQAAPEDIGSDRATLMYAGSEAAFREWRELLGLLGPARWLSPDPTAAAVCDLALFGLWYDAQLGLLRALDAAAAAGIEPADFAAMAARQVGHVVDGAAATADELAARTYPRGPASLREHLPVIEQIGRLRTDAPLGDGGLTAIERLVSRLVDAGQGDLGLTAVAQRPRR